MASISNVPRVQTKKVQNKQREMQADYLSQCGEDNDLKEKQRRGQRSLLGSERKN